MSGWHLNLSGPLLSRPAAAASRRQRGSTKHKVTGCLFIWLVLFSPAEAVQVWQQGHVNGHPVFNTGGVPATNDRYDLSPVRHPDVPVVDRQALCRPAYLKDICVFRADEQPCHQLLVADIRLHGPLLGSWICRALGLSDSEWSCRRLQEPLPAFPPEQLVLSPRSLPWHRTHIPVDLRPMGGTVTVCGAMRCQPCGDIVLQAMAGMPSVAAPAGFLCRCSQGWFLPSSYLTLLPCGDTLQAWPSHNLPSPSGGVVDDLSAAVTLEDRFALSLDRTPAPEIAFHEAAGHNVVIIGVNGHVYGDVPTFADHRIIRSAALQAFLRHERGTQEALHFTRILPPLDGLPAIQFAAVQCGGDTLPSVVDMRAVGGQLVALSVPDRALPHHCVQEAVRHYGEPDPRSPLHHQLQAGELLVLNNERVVDAFAPLHTDLPRALVLVRRQPRHAAYSEPSVAGYIGSDSSVSHGLKPGAWFYVFLHIASVGRLAHDATGIGGALPLSMLVVLLNGMWCSSSVSIPPMEWQDTTPPFNDASVGLASCLGHTRLASQWQWGSPEDCLGGPSTELDPGQRPQHYRIEAYSPSQWRWLWAPGSVTRAKLQESVSQLAVAPGRGDAVLANPQLLHRSVQLVVPARDANLRTVLVDVGVDIVCLDIPKAQAGQAILEALAFLFPARQFRLDINSNQPLRHGDVVVGLEDVLTSVELGPVLWPCPSLRHCQSSSRDTADAEEMLITAADLDLLPLLVPPKTGPQLLSAVLLQWLGRQRCLGIELRPLCLPAGLPRAFCLPRRGHGTLVATLYDVVDTARPFLVHTVDVEARCPPTLADLRRCTKHGQFWNIVLASRHNCVQLLSVPAEQSHSGFGFTQVSVEVDLSRAILFGLRCSAAMRPSLMDVQGRVSAIQVQRDIIRDATRHEVAVQTSPAHWHQLASPLFSAATPIRRAAMDCVLDTTYPAVGTLFHLECPFMGVHCTIPRTSRRHVWAVRIGDVVRGLCTPEVSWTILSEVIGVSAWDLPGIIVHNGRDAWEWPEELAPLAGSCGHVFLKESQQRGGHKICYPRSAGPVDVDNDWYSKSLATSVSGVFLGSMSGRLGILMLVGWIAGLPGGLSAPAVVDADAARPATGSVYDPTQTCNIGWCHELACQSTHFSTSTGRLTEYFRSHSPFPTVRVMLWQPFQGPVAFDIPREAPSVVLAQTLSAAGHDASMSQLIVAFDSQASTLDLLSVPHGHSIWRIVRDGLSRELLRPVAPWYHDRTVRVVTVNAHGQASGVIYSAEVASLKRLPQGARGMLSEPLTNVIGHLTASGLAITEVAIGTVTGLALALRPLWGSLLFLTCIVGGLRHAASPFQ